MLKNLFENAVLNDETKTVIQEAFEAAISAKENELTESYEAKLTEARAEMTTAMVELVEEAVTEEMEAIKDEIVHARTLEVQYAEKLQEFKESYAEAQEDRSQVMIAEAIAEEMEELREDIELAKKTQFAMKIFESFRDAYAVTFGETDVNAQEELMSLKEEVESLRREKKLSELLEGLEGNKLTIAKTILETVDTDKLEAKFESIHSVLIAQSENKVVEGEEKEGPNGIVVLENEDPENKVDVDGEDEDGKKVTESTDPLLNRLNKSLSWGLKA